MREGEARRTPRFAMLERICDVSELNRRVVAVIERAPMTTP